MLFCNSITTSALFDRNLSIIEWLGGSSNDSKTWQKHLFMVRSLLSVSYVVDPLHISLKVALALHLARETFATNAINE